MQTKEKNDLIFLRLYKNEDINKMIKKTCKKHNIKTAIVLSGIGQLDYVKLGYFKKKGDYCPTELSKKLEILSLSGNIIKSSDDYELHLHIVLGDEEKNSFGGHFIDGKISVTGEIVLLKTNINIGRVIDDDTGLKALSLE